MAQKEIKSSLSREPDTRIIRVGGGREIYNIIYVVDDYVEPDSPVGQVLQTNYTHAQVMDMKSAEKRKRS